MTDTQSQTDDKEVVDKSSDVSDTEMTKKQKEEREKILFPEYDRTIPGFC